MHWRIVAIGMIVCAAAPSGPDWHTNDALQPPSPSISEKSKPVQPPTHQTENEGSKQNYGTANDPLFIKIVPTEQADNARQQQTKNEDQKASFDRRMADSTEDLAIYTGGLVAATIVLALVGVGQLYMFYRQLGYMKDGVRDAKIAADAAAAGAKAAQSSADTAARALAELERPHLFVELKDGIIDTTYDEMYPDGAIEFDIPNYGRVPASVDGCYVGITQIGIFPKSGILCDEFHGIIGPGAKKERCRVHIPYNASLDTVVTQNSDEPPYMVPSKNSSYETIILIEIFYMGIGIEKYFSRFCWLWDHGVGRWVKYNDPSYNYRT